MVLIDAHPISRLSDSDPGPSDPLVSVVIPLMDEQETIRTLVTQVLDVLHQIGRRGDVLLIDDGSQDRSWPIIEELAGEFSEVRGIRFRRNFGKAAALAAGFEAARGDVVVTMDADLQDDPKEIPRFLEAIDAGFDVVSGWKKVRHDPWHKVGPSRVFNWLVGRLTGVRIHDHNCGFKAYRRQIFDQVKLYGEMHRFVPVLADARGWKVTEIEVLHHPREHGKSKYGVGRIVKGFLDLLTIYFLTRFAQRPLHLIGSAGLLCFSFGGIGLTILTVMWCVSRLSSAIDDINLHERAIFYYCILAILLGAQLLVAGLLAELMTAMMRPNIPPYSIARITGDAESKSS
ncbi:Undecaprenyl-phosphate 4-deoxy-4-formamido-L-arabinose transferase [Roseimaritima multifibrata]|uniref:Undecaprenyl-phosphate 4-deoxy-4-formamido-L-arabinose transferase n=1 Tax=Roseimaritima multifibrata TaxID=1930274 RepID=A0A517ML23_9BACT|nr:Undecaprenyl-phosphate 4-deoxy-4-formamido-L-arabinose transferase [Roseimaritima multifibrata]